MGKPSGKVFTCMRDTSLSAYRLLLDRYYSTEEGIPAAQAYRLARARSEEERQAVDAVLEEFFTLEDGVWISQRVELKVSEKNNALFQELMESIDG